jgi:di/tricarboxylate transporter
MPILNFLIMIILPAADVIPMEQSAILFSSMCFVCGWITPTQALEVIDFSLLIMIAASIGISRSMEVSGLSTALGAWLKNSEFSPW